MLDKLLGSSVSSLFPAKFMVDICIDPEHALIPGVLASAIAMMAYYEGMQQYDRLAPDTKSHCQTMASSMLAVLVFQALSKNSGMMLSVGFSVAAYFALDRYLSQNPQKLRQLTGGTYGIISGTLSYHMLNFASQTFFTEPKGPHTDHQHRRHDTHMGPRAPRY